MLLCAISASIIHTVGQLCDIFFLSFSLLSVWHLLNLSGVYWCNNWCLHSPHPSSSLWCFPCPYTMNTLASRLQNQLSRWEEGKSNLTAATRRGDCFSSQLQRSKSIVPVLRVLPERKKQGVERGKLLGCSNWTASLPEVKSHPFPPIFAVSRSPLSFYSAPHSCWHYLSVTRWHQGLHSCLQPSRWNGTIIMGIEWLWPPNWGCSNHNNTLSNLIK